MRKCVGCQEMKSKREMIRILKTESEGIILDATGKKNGRGAYICRSGECLEKAIRNHGIERSLKTGILPEIYDSLKKEIEKIESEYRKPEKRPAENFLRKKRSKRVVQHWLSYPRNLRTIQRRSSGICANIIRCRSIFMVQKLN